MPDWLHSLEDAQANLPGDPVSFRFHYALRHGSMKFGLYAPLGVDTQGPHKQDELYIVVSGTGRFVKNGQEKVFKQHDVIFVEAGAEHRFTDLSNDFSTWVVFWGPEGGEA